LCPRKGSNSNAGITPVIRQSGSRVRGQARISKIGNQKLRNLLFLCSFNACKKLALLAVCNKLLKQAFAIAKSRIPYDENYRSTLVKIS